VNFTITCLRKCPAVASSTTDPDGNNKERPSEARRKAESITLRRHSCKIKWYYQERLNHFHIATCARSAIQSARLVSG